MVVPCFQVCQKYLQELQVASVSSTSRKGIDRPIPDGGGWVCWWWCWGNVFFWKKRGGYVTGVNLNGVSLGVITQSIYRGYNWIAPVTGFFGAHPTRRKVGKQKGVEETGVMSCVIKFGWTNISLDALRIKYIDAVFLLVVSTNRFENISVKLDHFHQKIRVKIPKICETIT